MRIRNILALVAIVVLGVMAPMAAASGTEEVPQEYHHVDLVDTAASCNADGTQTATFVISNPSDDDAEIIDLHATVGPIVGAAVGDEIEGNSSIVVSITTSGSQTGSIHLYVELEWPNYDTAEGHSEAVLLGDCVAVPPVTVIETVPGPTVEIPGPTQFVQVPVPAPVVVASARFTG